jgi:hypothetical protein
MLGLLTGCVGAEFVRQPDPGRCPEPPVKGAKTSETEVRATLHSFVDAVEQSDFDGAFRLLDATLKRRYSPERLKADFAIEPRGAALVNRLKQALHQPVQIRGTRASLLVAEGRVATLVRESDEWHVSTLDGDSAQK